MEDIFPQLTDTFQYIFGGYKILYFITFSAVKKPGFIHGIKAISSQGVIFTLRK